jgi:cytochrome c556
MRSKIRSIYVYGAVMAGLAVSPLSAVADDAPPPEDTVAARIAGFRELGAAFKNVNDEMKAKAPNVFVIQISAPQIRTTSRDIYFWFPPETAPRPGLKTNAKPEIWTSPADFKMAQDAFATEAGVFMDAVTAGDVAKIKQETKLLGDTCSNCHQKFRNEEKH